MTLYLKCVCRKVMPVICSHLMACCYNSVSHDSKFRHMYNDLGESVLVKSMIQHINGHLGLSCTNIEHYVDARRCSQYNSTDLNVFSEDVESQYRPLRY